MKTAVNAKIELCGAVSPFGAKICIRPKGHLEQEAHLDVGGDGKVRWTFYWGPDWKE